MSLYTELKELCFVSGVSGREKKICELIRSKIDNYVDSTRVDSMGNLIALKKGSVGEKKIMLCAHMDEIGFIVNYIDDKGFVRVATLGGVSLIDAAFSFVVSERGVQGALVPESNLKSEELKADKMYIDIGASSRVEAERRVAIGDFFVREPSLCKMSGKRVCGRPIDDRVGCLVLLEVAKALATAELKDDVYFVFSVQEEVGCRGSKPASFGISPDEAICVDVTCTGDTIGATPMECALGKGAAIKVKDSSVICHEDIVKRLSKIAKENKISTQLEVLLAGGTDTSSVQMSAGGCKAGAVSIPTRYVHSGVEMCDLFDVQACISLLSAYILQRG